MSMTQNVVSMFASRVACRMFALLGAMLFAARALGVEVHDIEFEEHRLHMECSGRGAPVVVFDAGLGGSALEWALVMDRLQSFTRVCRYDRAGYGDSDMGPLPRTSSRIAHELERLLSVAGEPPPYILVGHSFGGYNMQMFARRYAASTAGLVLIDASHPDQVERFAAPPLNIVTAPLSRTGVVQFREPPPASLALPAALRQRIQLQARHWRTRRTLSAELLSFRDSAAEVRAAPPLGNLPLMVISRGRLDGEATPKRLLFEQLWLELQNEMAGASAASAHLLALHSGHHIHLEQPDVVAFAIGLMVARTRGADAMSEWVAQGARALDGATWLKNDLSLDPRPALAAAPCAPMCAPAGAP